MEAPPPACPLAALARSADLGLHTSARPQPRLHWPCTPLYVRSLGRPALLREGISPRQSWAGEKLLPRGARRTPGQSARGSHEAQMASQMHHLAPSTTSPHPRDGDPARAKVGQVLTARPAALGPAGRAGARSSLQAGVGLRNAARPGRIALQRLGRPQPLGDLASNYASGLVSSVRGADSGDSRENLHRNNACSPAPGRRRRGRTGALTEPASCGTPRWAHLRPELQTHLSPSYHSERPSLKRPHFR